MWLPVIDLFSRRAVGLVDQCRNDVATRDRCPGDGDLAAGQARRAAPSLRSRQPIHQQAVPEADVRDKGSLLLDEPLRQHLGQCGNGELLLLAEDRAHRAQDVWDARRSQGGMCSTTLNASIIRNIGTRRSDM